MDPGVERRAAARPGAAGLATTVLFHGDRHVQARQRPVVRQAPSVRAEDLHLPPFAGEADADLHHARVAGAGEGVDLLQQVGLGGEGEPPHGVGVVIELGIGGSGRIGGHALIAPLGEAGGGRGAAQGRLADLAGVGVARRLARHDAQAEAFRGVIARRFQTPVVEQQALAVGALQEQFPVVGAAQRLGKHRLRPIRRHAAELKKGP